MADENYPAEIELPEQRGQIRNMTVETMRLFTCPLFQEAKPDHVWDDHTVPGTGQGLNEVAVEKPPCRVTMEQDDRIAGPLVDIMHSPPVDSGKTRGPRPLLADADGQRAVVHAELLASQFLHQIFPQTG
jgi:hypothetical protein